MRAVLVVRELPASGCQFSSSHSCTIQRRVQEWGIVVSSWEPLLSRGSGVVAKTLPRAVGDLAAGAPVLGGLGLFPGEVFGLAEEGGGAVRFQLMDV